MSDDGDVYTANHYFKLNDTVGILKEIRGLKCPNHDYVRDNYKFTYESIGGMAPTNSTRCKRCGYTKSLHRPQK